MNRKAILGSSALAVAALATFGASAGVADPELGYTFIEGGYQDIDLDRPRADGDGYAIRASLAITPVFHLFGGYSSGDLDGSGAFSGKVDYDNWELGTGLSYALTERVHFVGQASYLNTEFDHATGRFDDEGYGLYAGLRGRFGLPVELEGGIKYVDFSDRGDDTLLKLASRYYFSEQWAAGLSFDVGDDETIWGLNVRWELPRR
jgi:hypothetical protein